MKKYSRSEDGREQHYFQHFVPFNHAFPLSSSIVPYHHHHHLAWYIYTTKRREYKNISMRVLCRMPIFQADSSYNYKPGGNWRQSSESSSCSCLKFHLSAKNAGLAILNVYYSGRWRKWEFDFNLRVIKEHLWIFIEGYFVPSCPIMSFENEKGWFGHIWVCRYLQSSWKRTLK